MQNIHYADTSGHIGFIAPGRADPQERRRALAGAGMDRRIRLAGLDSVRGLAPDDRPGGRRTVQRQQPDRARGLPLPADRRLGGPASGRAGSPSFSSATHSGRLIAAMQADVLSLLAQDLLPIMLAAPPRGPAAAAAMARLETGTG